MTREITTTEALMTDPTTPEGRAYWQDRHDYEAALYRQDYEAALEQLSDEDGVPL